MNVTHDNKHIAILSRFVVDCELEPVLNLDCDHCISFIEYVTDVDEFGHLVRKKKTDLDEVTFKLLMYGKMVN